MGPNEYKCFKSLLLGLPGWNQAATRRAFLRDLFWGQDLLNQLNDDVPGDRAASELLELLGKLDAPTVDGLTPACALLRAIAEKYGAGPARGAALAQLERALCASAQAPRSVLFLAANPQDEPRIRTDREYQRIKEALSSAPGQGQVTLHPPELALRVGDLTKALHRTQPGVVHFAGHGGGDAGLMFEDEQGQARPVSAPALASVLRLFKHCVKVVVLNACFSEPQAAAIAADIDYVIGTRQAIGDDTAVAFSVGFYQALAAGRSVPDAFQLGCAQIRLEGIPEHAVPVLLARSGKVSHCG
jgi:hypothetical protein